MDRRDGMNYAPKGIPKPVCKPGDFVVGVVGLDHGHIHGMCNGLLEAGADIALVFDPDADKVAAFCKQFPSAKAASSEEEVLSHPRVHLIASAKIPNERGPLGVRVMEHGKDYFTDKGPFTSLEQLDEAKRVAARTGRKYMVYYSERLHNESGVYAGELIEQGAIGQVIQVIGTGPHRLNASSRPSWFFKWEQYGGILCDIGSHQVEQFLYYTGAKDATVQASKVGNYFHREYPELEDFGDATLIGDNGATGYFRVDWLTPNGLSVFGDGRTILLGSKGYIELRKYTDVAREPDGDHVYLVNDDGAVHIPVAGKVGYPFFGQLILDCLERTERAMTQAHAFKAAELCLVAQRDAHIVRAVQ